MASLLFSPSLLAGLSQSAPAMQWGNQSPLPAGSIDGAVNPELIPDVVAYRLFFSAAAEGSSPSSLQVVRQDAKLRPIQLAPDDKAALVDALSEFKNNIAQALTLPSPVPGYLDATAQATVDRLRTKMSAGGFQRMEAYVRSQKRLMKRVPYPDMAGHGH